jgi:hypothetical protein
MLIELGNVGVPEAVSLDSRPKVTAIHIPEFDDGSTHPDAVYEGGRHPCEDHFDRAGKLTAVGKLVKPGPRLGGYTHKAGGISVADFKAHIAEAGLFGQPTRLADHELLQSVIGAWPHHSGHKPSWVQVTPHGDGRPKSSHHSAEACLDVENFLHELFDTGGARKPGNVEETHWTRFGPPGRGPVAGQVIVPDLNALLTDDGRSLYGTNVGGGQVGTSGTASATSSTSLTSGAITSVLSNQYAGYRLYSPTAWANVKSHTSGTTPVFTVDRWYSYATPGGSAASTPGSTTTFVIADGGAVSAWFVALTTTNITPAHGDHSMTGEITTAGGGLIRKIAPFALTSGTSPLTWTLTPVFTANGTDSLPATAYAIGVFNSMVGPDTTLTMFFETLMNASATFSASGDQFTVTETGTGS